MNAVKIRNACVTQAYLFYFFFKFVFLESVECIILFQNFKLILLNIVRCL